MVGFGWSWDSFFFLNFFELFLVGGVWWGLGLGGEKRTGNGYWRAANELKLRLPFLASIFFESYIFHHRRYGFLAQLKDF